MMEIMQTKKNKTIILMILCCLIFPKILHADKAYFDLSDEIIKIQTNFNGREVIIFGLADPNYDTILIIKGPDKDAKLSIKERLFGIWIETKKFNYKNIPSLFFIASSAPINVILEENIIRNRGLNFKNFNNNTFNNSNVKDTKIYEDSLYEWDKNLIRKQKVNNFYKQYYLKTIDNKLFQTRVFFPPNTIPGIYNVNIFQIKNKKIINEDNKKIIIQKTGIGNQIYNFAQKKPSFYGMLCIIFAVISGIIAATAFRRL